MRLWSLLLHFKLLSLSQVFRLPAILASFSLRVMAQPLLTPFALVRHSPTLMVSTPCHSQICSGVSCFHLWDHGAASSCRAPLLCSALLIKSLRLLGADSVSSWSSPRPLRPPPPQPYWPLDGCTASLHRCLAINYTLSCDTSCTTLSCYLSLA